MLATLKVGLASDQVARLIQLMDEGKNGEIRLKEFNDVLVDYGQVGEGKKINP